ncbi:MAG: DUF4838 domain-containing protein [Clostridia bacterium]|nr:DUF4838 domain-containing protein [Clostridia bacterium]
MKKTTRILALISAFLLSASCFFGCKGTASKPSTTTASDVYDPDAGIDRKKIVAPLVENGRTEYKIVHSANVTETEEYACEELQSLLYQSTGVALPIVSESLVSNKATNKIISVGETELLANAGFDIDREALSTDGFVLKTKGNGLYIYGNNQRGTLYGVYDFLEKIVGVKFITSDCTYVPELSKIDLPTMNVTEVPYFPYRGMWTYQANQKTEISQTWYARSRNNNEFAVREEKYGGGIEWAKQMDPVHSTLSYVPNTEYYVTEEQKAENAHMYCIKNGNVLDICFTDGMTEDGKIDESMEVSAIKVALESFKNFALAEPEAKYFSFGFMDTTESCTCADCVKSNQKYTITGTYIRFANLLMEEFNKWKAERMPDREVYLMIFAYMNRMKAPLVFNEETEKYEVREGAALHEDIYVRITPWWANHYYALTDPNQTQTWAHTVLEEWSYVTDNVMAWTYAAAFGNCHWYYPVRQKYVDQIKEFGAVNTEYMFVQLVGWEPSWQTYMDEYVLSKLLWNPNRDVNQLTAEFCYYYFGDEADDEVMQFVTFFDEYYRVAEETSNRKFFFQQLTGYTYHKLEYLEYGLEVLDTAKEQVNASTSYSEAEKQTLAKRLDLVRLTPLYMRMYNGNQYFQDNKTKRQESVNAFFDLCYELGIAYYGENRSIYSLFETYGYQEK